MAKNVPIDKLGDAIAEQLTVYHENVLEEVNTLSDAAAKELVKITKRTAPKQSGDFRKHISSKLLETSRTGSKNYVWYVRAPHHRLTHLLVHGHAKVNGGRVKGSPFLHNAWDQVRADYERKVEEALKNG